MTPDQRGVAVRHVYRVLEAVAGGWHSDAKSRVADFAHWAHEHVDPQSPDGARLHAALRTARDFDLPWERRCNALAKAVDDWVDSAWMASSTPSG